MNIQQILKIDPNDIAKMNRSDLARIVRPLVSASNKRIRRLQASETGRMSPSIAPESMTGGKQFSIRGQNLNQLRNSYAKMKQYLNNRTSSLTGFKAYRNEVSKRIGGKLSYEQEKQFWETYNKLREQNHSGLFNTLSSSQIQKKLYRTYQTKKFNIDDIQNLTAQERSDLADAVMLNMNKKMNTMYNQKIKRQSSNAKFFELSVDDGTDL